MSLEFLTVVESQKHIDEENIWLKKTSVLVDSSIYIEHTTAWAAYHASRQLHDGNRTIFSTTLLPLLTESAHTVAMIRHSMDVVRNAVEHLNPGQTPIITFDQPLFALAKQIQWTWPDHYGENKVLVLFGGLHIEMAALKTLGDWLQGSGWKEALIQVSAWQHSTFFKVKLMNTTNEQLSCEDWCKQRRKVIPQFPYLHSHGSGIASTDVHPILAPGIIHDVHGDTY